jgi:pyruvate formate lyase activating enzyme
MPREVGQIMGEVYSPAGLVGLALNHQCSAMAYTYTEPTIFYELAKDTMVEAKRHGLYNVFVTNGYMTREMLDDAKGLIDAANVDLKAFNQAFYTDYVNGRLKGVMDSLTRMKQMGLWVEVTTLLIPGVNDDPEEIRAIARFIKSEMDPETPWHLSRFHPAYQERNLPPTELSVLEDAKRIGLEEGLHYVYLGNVPGEGENTNCPQCSHLLIDRVGYTIQHYSLDDGACPKCGYKVAGVGL